MTLLARLFGGPADDHADVRALWHRVVEIAREPRWYAYCGVADTVAGRFDAVTAVLALVLLRMEGDEALARPLARLTELFVTDMDGQLRESGVGDLVVGKHIRRLMEALGGRLDAYRAALASADPDELRAAVGRNVTLVEGRDPAAVAAEMRRLAEGLAVLTDQDLLEGKIAR